MDSTYQQPLTYPTNASHDYHREGERSKIRTSLPCAILTHFVLCLAPILLYIFCSRYDTGMEDAPDFVKYNRHPVAMTIAFCFFMGEALIAYRVLPFEHDVQKAIHFGLHSLALISSTLGIVWIYQFHSVNGYPHFYDIHSIVGLSAYLLFLVQYLLGTISFYVPWVPNSIRAAVMPYHKYIGIVIFVMTWLAMLSGVLNRQRIQSKEMPYFEAAYRMSNAAGAFIVLSAVCIIFHFSPASKQKDAPEAERLL